jgi:hypothetical protein
MNKIIFLLLLSVSVNAQAVYKTPSGNRYHNEVCRTVRNVSEMVTVERSEKSGTNSMPCV